MATTFLKPLHVGKGRSIAQALGRSTDYVKNPDKTDNGEWVSAYQCNPAIVDAEFLFSKRQYVAQTGKAHKLADKTKANEARLKEITELQRQIGIYGKTREVYLQYKKLPQKKQAAFYEAHRSDIMLHGAAKRYFDSLGLEKLPSIKALKQEYAALSAENKKLYPDQKEARSKMIDLLTVKSNVERFLEIKIEQPDKKEQQQEESR